MDPRLELIGVIQLLDPSTSTPYGFSWSTSPYTAEATRHFGPLRNHEAVRRNATLDRTAFGWNTQAKALQLFSPLPKLEPVVSLFFHLTEAAGGQEAFDRWLQGLRTFAEDSGFDGFYRAHKSLNDADLEAYEAKVRAVDPTGRIERYTGLTFNGRFRVLLSPFIAPNAEVIGLDLIREDGSYELIAGFSTNQTFENSASILFHELSHGVLDTTADLYWEALEARRDPAYADCFGSWRQCVKEAINDAVKLRLMEYLRVDQNLKLDLVKPYTTAQVPFSYMPALLERLKEYERSRDVYPTIVDFYPRLLEVFPLAPRNEAGQTPDPAQRLLLAQGPLNTPADYRRALLLLDRLLEVSGDRPGPNPELLLKRGVFRQLLGRSELAVRDADAVLAAKPGDPAALLLKCRARGDLACRAAVRQDQRFATDPKSRPGAYRPPSRSGPVPGIDPTQGPDPRVGPDPALTPRRSGER